MPYTVTPFQAAEISPVAAWKEVIQQLSLIELGDWQLFKDSGIDYHDKSVRDKMLLNLSELIARDPTELDRYLGLCSVPLYDFSPNEVEEFHTGSNVDNLKRILKEKDILQYFFPAPDQLALGMVDSDNLKVETLIDRLSKVPELGHPFGETELVASSSHKILDVVDSLRNRGYLVEGEIGLETTEDGEKIRNLIRYKPREGLISKISKIFSVKLDLSLKDLWPK